MKGSVFLSYPKPSYARQEEFVTRVRKDLENRGFTPRTLGVTDYDINAPLTTIRRLMIESNGLITIAFRRSFVENGTSRLGTDIPGLAEHSINGNWLTTPWAHIEPAMAYQLGLPILIFRESGVLADGILERGVVGLYMPEFDLDFPVNNYFDSVAWTDVISTWAGNVRAVIERKGKPPQLY